MELPPTTIVRVLQQLAQACIYAARRQETVVPGFPPRRQTRRVRPGPGGRPGPGVHDRRGLRVIPRRWLTIGV